MRRRKDRERYVEEFRPERTRREQLRGDGEPADFKKTEGQGHEHLTRADRRRMVELW